MKPMHVLTAFGVLAAIALATPAVPPIPPDSGATSAPIFENTALNLSDEAAAGIQGALEFRYYCAIAVTATGAGMIAAAIVTGGTAAAILAPFVLNAAMLCLL